MSLFGVDVVLADRRRVVGGGRGVGAGTVIIVGGAAAGVSTLVVVVGGVWSAGSGEFEGRRSLPRRARSCAVDCLKRLCILGLFRAISFWMEHRRCRLAPPIGPFVQCRRPSRGCCKT